MRIAVVVLLGLIELRNGNNTVQAAHVTHIITFNVNQTQSNHSGLILCEHGADGILLLIGAALHNAVEAVIFVNEQIDLIDCVGETLNIDGILEEVVLVLGQNIELASTPISVNADLVVIGDKAVAVAGILHTVTVEVGVDVLRDLSLIIQSPLAVIDNIVQIGNLILIEKILVKEGNENEAIQRQTDRTGGEILRIADGCGLIKALRPVGLLQIQIGQIRHILEQVVSGVHDGCVYTICKQVELIGTCLNLLTDGLGDLVVVRAGGQVVDDINAQTIRNSSVTIVDSVIDNVTGEILNGNLILTPIAAAADDGNGLTVVLQILGKVILYIITLGGGLLDNGGSIRRRSGGSSGGSGNDFFRLAASQCCGHQHDQRQKQRQTSLEHNRCCPFFKLCNCNPAWDSCHL